MSKTVIQCDGCGNDFGYPYYHCVKCSNIDFCARCYAHLEATESKKVYGGTHRHVDHKFYDYIAYEKDDPYIRQKLETERREQHQKEQKKQNLDDLKLVMVKK